ncbi:hypothetical protein AFK68_13145 [Hydrocoleum sp. CS-953]|uniref:dynamin family protein n=1 Tax=Hydrocoleum sp. CS-953 TaxID=1671698 RepID=UPI000B9B0519|nr:dynamin family protein [Hydrocoleum sp. CS-953]OZH54092.1 hypothetical protein AFK68_13145 [Hydrocoleum sp. CS-953]
MDTQSKLDSARNLFQELGNSLANLVNAAPEVFADETISRKLDDFNSAYQGATKRLENPSLSIATIGTTSSGKSTIINALMGRKIAPIEAGEMSGGVLTLKHSQERKLIIEETPDAVWERGEWIDLTDEEIYQKIRVVMHSYHEQRKKKECIAPQIQVYIPLLPANDLSLSGLPEGIGIDFLDLPGLKSVQDRANLQVIQPLVGKAFSLVALDYLQVDEQHRQKLLGELKRVVEYFQGRTDSMIFILNRVDNRGADDLPLEVRLEQLKKEIKQELDLPELPDVIPFNARLLYYAQCAWGATALRSESTVISAERTKFLKALFEDCAKVIKQNTDGDLTVKNWFREREDNLELGNPPDDYQMRRIRFYALKWSGGEALWSCINNRIQESFSELVILPALLDVFNSFDVLDASLNNLIEVRKIDNQEQVKTEREKITKIRQDLQKNVQRIGKDFQQEVQEYIEKLKEDDPNTRIEIKQYAEKKGYQGWSLIFDAVAEVEGDLTKCLILPMRDAFENNESTHNIQDKLGEVINPGLAKDIAKSYDNVSRRLDKFEKKSDAFYRKVRADDESEIKELEHDEKYVRLLYHTMRQGMTARAEFTLQTKAKQFEEGLKSLVDDQLKRLKVCLSEKELAAINLEEVAIKDLRKKLAENLPTLPEKLFELPDNIQQNRTQESEVVGTETYYENVTKTRNETYTEEYKSGSCLKQTKTRTRSRPVEYTDTEERTRDVYEDIEYIELFLPSPKLMVEQWLSGVEKGKDSLWDILRNWIINRLDYVSNLFEESVIDITNLAERTLDEQLRLIELNFEEQKKFWESFEVEKNMVNGARKKLENNSRD